MNPKNDKVMLLAVAGLTWYLKDQRCFTPTSSVVVSEKHVSFHLHGGSHSWDPYCWKTVRATMHGEEGWGRVRRGDMPSSTSPLVRDSNGPLDNPRGTGEQDGLPHFTLAGMPILRCQFSPNWSTDSMQEKSFSPKMLYPH